MEFNDLSYSLHNSNTGDNGNHKLWLAYLHSKKMREVFNSNELLWLVKRKGKSTPLIATTLMGVHHAPTVK